VGPIAGNHPFGFPVEIEVEVITLEGDSVESHMESLDAVEMLSSSVLMADMTSTTVADSASNKAA
jgi:hypothetical protein